MYNPDWLRYCKRIVRVGLGSDHLLGPEIKVPTTYVGSAYGGWMIATNPLQDTKAPVVLSFGLGDDISFDEGMIESFGARVYGFDPTPVSQRWLAERGVPSGMQVQPIGIAAFDGERVFSMPDHEMRGNFSSRQSSGTKITCQVRRYSTILTMLRLSQVDVLKLDIEGSEYEVIDDVITSSILPTQLLIEFHHRLHGIHVSETRRCVEAIRRLGFSLFAVSPGGQEMSFIRL